MPGNLAERGAQLASSSARSRPFIYTGRAGAALPTSQLNRTSTAGAGLLTLLEPAARAPGQSSLPALAPRGRTSLWSFWDSCCRNAEQGV